MTDSTNSDRTPTRQHEEKLAHALISRGLITREEAQQCRGDKPEKLEAFLSRLVKSGFLTAHQARRAAKEIALLLNEQIPGYQLMEKLGQGAMGVVFKARQVSMNRLVAVKVLHSRWAKKAEFLERFQTEARLAARLSHNNIVQAIDVGSAGPLHYFVMELIEGENLKTRLDEEILDEKEAIEIVLQIAQALQHAHRRGLIHRDVKPANIVLTEDGIAKLSDLGLARETEDEDRAEQEKGVAMGTPFYISPEQIYGDVDVDVRADIYSLGGTLYHMVTGQPPYPYKTIDEVIDAHLHEELTPPDELQEDLSAGLSEVVGMMMAKDREDRYQTPDDLILDLGCLLNDEPPRIARKKIASNVLAELEKGEVELEEIERIAEEMAAKYHVWIGVLAAILALSIVVNIFMIIL